MGAGRCVRHREREGASRVDRRLLHHKGGVRDAEDERVG